MAGIADAAVVTAALDSIFRSDSRAIFATLVRLLGDFDLAEDAMQEAFAAALLTWPQDGIPRSPRSWLISTGRFKAIDQLRRRARLNSLLPAIAEQVEATVENEYEWDDLTIADDQLRLIFTCCHPDLSPEARMALTLREVCGLTTEEIAHAFLLPVSTLARRIVRAKSRIRTACIPYCVPSKSELPVRLNTALHVVYLLFNEGYLATTGACLTRSDLSTEAIRLGRLLLQLLTEPEVMGLLALMLLHESRREARSNADGEIVLLQDQDRALWNREYIVEGITLVERALSGPNIGAYSIQAAIAAVHAEAGAPDATDWPQIVALYDVLMRFDSSPVVRLNQAVAIAMRDGPQAGLDIIDGVLAEGSLNDYHLAYSARAEMCRARLGRSQEARSAYERALALTHQHPERRFFERRLAELI